MLSWVPLLFPLCAAEVHHACRILNQNKAGVRVQEQADTSIKGFGLCYNIHEFAGYMQPSVPFPEVFICVILQKIKPIF